MLAPCTAYTVIRHKLNGRCGFVRPRAHHEKQGWSSLVPALLFSWHPLQLLRKGKARCSLGFSLSLSHTHIYAHAHVRTHANTHQRTLEINDPTSKPDTYMFSFHALFLLHHVWYPPSPATPPSPKTPKPSSTTPTLTPSCLSCSQLSLLGYLMQPFETSNSQTSAHHDRIIYRIQPGPQTCASVQCASPPRLLSIP